MKCSMNYMPVKSAQENIVLFVTCVQVINGKILDREIRVSVSYFQFIFVKNIFCLQLHWYFTVFNLCCFFAVKCIIKEY